MHDGFLLSISFFRLEDEREAPEVDASGQEYITIAELQRQEAQRRAGAPICMLPLLLLSAFAQHGAGSVSERLPACSTPRG